VIKSLLELSVIAGSKVSLVVMGCGSWGSIVIYGKIRFAADRDTDAKGELPAGATGTCGVGVGVFVIFWVDAACVTSGLVDGIVFDDPVVPLIRTAESWAYTVDAIDSIAVVFIIKINIITPILRVIISSSMGINSCI